MSNISMVVFAYPILHPRGGMASSIRAEDGVTMTRQGDTLVVAASLPENDARGLPIRVTRHYNWAAVTWLEYAETPEESPARKRQ